MTEAQSTLNEIEDAIEQDEIEESLANDPEGSDLSTDPITDNGDGLDEKLSDEAVIGSIGVAVAGDALLKAITICQPYAHLIVTGAKRVENRTWPTDYRGPILIHAGKSKDFLDIQDGKDAQYDIPLADMAFGSIVGLSKIIDCLHIDEILAGKHDEKYPWLRDHEHTEGPYCFVLNTLATQFTVPVPFRGAQGIFNVPADVVKDYINNEPVAEPFAETPVDPPAEKKPITIDHDAEVKMLREHDRELRELAEEHQDLESEWETAKLQAKGAKDRLDECALRLRNAALRRPTFGPLFDKPADEPAAPTVPPPVEAAPNLPDNAWRDLPLKGSVMDSVADAAARFDLQTFGNVFELLEINAEDDLVADMASVGVSEEDAKALIARTHELAGSPAEEKAEEKPVDPDYWKAVDIKDLSLAGKLTEKLREQGINTLGELSEAVAKCGHEGYRGLDGVGAAKAEQIENAWMAWFAAHPAPVAPAAIEEDTPAAAPVPIIGNATTSVIGACGQLGFNDFEQVRKYVNRIGRDIARENLIKWGAKGEELDACFAAQSI